jgi:hypothetical protein
MTKLRIIIFLFLVQSNQTFCKVIQKSFGEQCRKASEIFIGKVTNLEILSQDKYFKQFRIQFVTSKAWKGVINDTMTCFASESFCSYNRFEFGNEYLIYSQHDTIKLGSGRSGDIGLDFIKSDIRLLNIRYIFRRPPIISKDKNMQTLNCDFYKSLSLKSEELISSCINKVSIATLSEFVYFDKCITDEIFAILITRIKSLVVVKVA